MIKHHQQVSLLDCGVACVKTILSFYNLEGNVEKYFDASNSQGMSLLDIENILKKYNIRSESYQIDSIEILKELDEPYIAVVNRNSLPHYVVVISIDGFTVKISDPASAKFTELDFSVFEEKFAGIILLPHGSDKSISLHIEDRKKLSESEILYEKFISNLSLSKKVKLFILGASKTILPIVMSLLLQYIMVNVVTIRVSNQIFLVCAVLSFLLIFKIFSHIEVMEKTEIENSFLSIILQEYYHEQFDHYTGETHYDFVIGYFWNLLNSVTGIFQKFYLRIYFFIFSIIILFLMYFNLIFACVSTVGLMLFFLYNRNKLNDVEMLQREMVSISSNFSYLFESSIDGIYDISSFNKKELFYREFQQRLFSMLDVKFSSAKLNEQIMSSVQVFSVVLISVLILSSHFFNSNSSIAEYSNAVLIILLMASILQPLLVTWITYKRSQYSLNFINVRDGEQEIEHINLSKIGVNGIEKIKISNLAKVFDKNVVFQNLNFEFIKGNVYILRGENGSGKTTLFKILQGFISPTDGVLEINDIKYDTLIGTDIRKYMGVYSNAFRLFAGSIENNIKFKLFDHSVSIAAGNDDFVDLPITYQISSNGKNLSQGQLQKILLKRSLYGDKSVYLFDEPTSNLDSKSKYKFIKLVQELQSKGKIICIITHDKDIVEIASDILSFD